MSVIPITDFYDHEELTEKLHRLIDAAPDLLSMSSIGTSPEGRELWCVEAANTAVGPAVETRSALLVTANMHAREVAGSWVSLHLLDHLVSAYGDDPAVTEALDERALYVIPRIAPDGADYVLDKRTWGVRSRNVELTDREANAPDVVHPRDVDGDGRIRTMRWRASDGDEKRLEGTDLLVSREPDDVEGEFYRSTVEGVVPEYTGGPVREPDTRSDFNRNFPSKAWDTFDWIGHGKYPLSEPETRALAEFVYDRPNITGVVDLHTGNPAVFYPSAMTRDDRHDEDETLLERIGRRAEELTTFPYLSSYDEVRGEERETALPGSFKDFVYERHGVPAYVVELGMFYNYLGMDTEDLALPTAEHERTSNRLLLEWHEENPEYGLFDEWETHEHPQLGTVEIGGWDPVLWCNPPKDDLPDVASDVTSFVLEFSEQAPELHVSFEAESIGDDLYRLTAELENRGRLPTNLTKRGLETHTRAEPIVDLETEGGVEIVSGRSRRTVGHLEGRGGRESVEWIVRAPSSARFTLTGSTPRGARATAELDLEG
ncbi:M14 family zinc carboxypeptidase [Halomontanus rarus]|uniref:M14 family zinc carboxypeptidase n=1 Tax=Halomontanus rarus TaxID=3034020 RepID=UPI001A9878ED